jgi:putative ATPase
MQNIPFAERVRPHSLKDFFGQEHLTGKGAPLRRYIETGNIPSIREILLNRNFYQTQYKV